VLDTSQTEGVPLSQLARLCLDCGGAASERLRKALQVVLRSVAQHMHHALLVILADRLARQSREASPVILALLPGYGCRQLRWLMWPAGRIWSR